MRLPILVWVIFLSFNPSLIINIKYKEKRITKKINKITRRINREINEIKNGKEKSKQFLLISLEVFLQLKPIYIVLRDTRDNIE